MLSIFEQKISAFQPTGQSNVIEQEISTFQPTGQSNVKDGNLFHIHTSLQLQTSDSHTLNASSMLCYISLLTLLKALFRDNHTSKHSHFTQTDSPSAG